MPQIYQARCDDCSYASDPFLAEYGAVLVDDPPAGVSKSVVAGAVLYEAVGNVRIAKQADPHLVVLAHPLEGSILATTGYTLTSLAWAGRYVQVRQVVCRDCGTLFETRRLTCPGGLGCMTGCISGLGTGVVSGVWAQNFWLGLAIGYGTTFGCVAVASAVGWEYTRLRFRERARKMDGPWACPRCRSDHYTGVESRRVFPCPKCSERTMSILSVGIS